MSDSQRETIDERKRRVEFLLRELQCEVIDAEKTDMSYSATFCDNSEFEGQFFIDEQSNFFEISLMFAFSLDFQDYLRDRMEEILQICYEFGIYINFTTSSSEIILGIYTKVYYSGLNYMYLKQSISDFKNAENGLTKIFDLGNEIQSDRI